MEEIVVAVPTKVPWKENKIMHIRITCCGETVDDLKKMKTGDTVSVKGFIEQTGLGKEKEFKKSGKINKLWRERVFTMGCCEIGRSRAGP